MTNPTQLVISEQAREVAEDINQQVEQWINNTPCSITYVATQIQLLLNSQREAIIRECAEEAKLELFKIGRYGEGRITHRAILAKLQNK